MSIRQRLLDLAKANLNSILDKAADRLDPRSRLSDVSDVDLEAELARRRAMRLAQARVTEAKARVDAPATGRNGQSAPGTPAENAGMPKDREARERAARERETKVRAAREAREREERERGAKEREVRARDARARDSRARAHTGAAGGSAEAGARPQGRPSTLRRDPQLARHYDVLELAYGSDFDTVKTAYRRLMRKYHPDLHLSSPEKLKAATEVSQALTQAYNELEKVLLGGPNRR